jgi:hypothetical protein
MTMREIAALRTLIGERISATEALFETKIMLGREGGSALKELIEAKLADMRDLLQERYATQTKALDAAFLAQQAAVATSFDASEKAMAAALLAAKEAVEKANLANEKRFDSVNEFRAQLNDMIGTLLPRAEAEVRFTGLDSKVADNKDSIAGMKSADAAAAGRLLGTATSQSEGRDMRADSRGSMAIVVSAIAAAAALLLTLVTAMHLAH